MHKREPQSSLVNGKNGHEGAGEPREFVTTRWSLILSAARLGSEEHGARDATVRGTALQELEAMTVRTSQYNPGQEVPEKSWLYRLAKRFWFNDFGVYRGHDHSHTAAPGVLRQAPISALRSDAGAATDTPSVPCQN